jgi:hypothetical protein
MERGFLDHGFCRTHVLLPILSWRRLILNMDFFRQP